jgi:hypothetical protein
VYTRPRAQRYLQNSSRVVDGPDGPVVHRTEVQRSVTASRQRSSDVARSPNGLEFIDVSSKPSSSHPIDQNICNPIDQNICKGEYTYGGYSARGEKTRSLKRIGRGFMLLAFYLVKLLLATSIYY